MLASIEFISILLSQVNGNYFSGSLKSNRSALANFYQAILIAISLMNMQPRIETLSERKLIGMRLSMSLSNNQTFKLWQSFMPRRKEVGNNLTNDLISMQVYPSKFDFTFFKPIVEFEKWAAVEVSDFENVPKGMEAYCLPAGLYAGFEYKGLSTDTTIFKYIFGEWLPNSTHYSLDDRPHFEILGDKYKNNDPTSEEEIWIPIKLIQY